MTVYWLILVDHVLLFFVIHSNEGTPTCLNCWGTTTAASGIPVQPVEQDTLMMTEEEKDGHPSIHHVVHFSTCALLDPVFPWWCMSYMAVGGTNQFSLVCVLNITRTPYTQQWSEQEMAELAAKLEAKRDDKEAGQKQLQYQGKIRPWNLQVMVGSWWSSAWFLLREWLVHQILTLTDDHSPSPQAFE